MLRDNYSMQMTIAKKMLTMRDIKNGFNFNAAGLKMTMALDRG